MSHDHEDVPGHRLVPLLSIERRELVAGILLGVRGEVDLNTGDQFAEELRHAVGRAIAAAARVVVDLRGVTFFGAVGLGILARANEDCGRAGVTMTVVADQASVLRVLRIVGLDRMLPVLRVPPAAPGPIRNGAAGQRHGGG